MERTSKQRWIAVIASLALAVAAGGILAGIVADDAAVHRPSQRAVEATAKTALPRSSVDAVHAAGALRGTIFEPVDGSTTGVIEIIGEDEDHAEPASAPEADDLDGDDAGALRDRGTSYAVSGVRNPLADERTVRTPSVGVPATCAVDACEGAEVGSADVSTPEVEPRSVATRDVHVDGRCAELVCVGAFTVRGIERTTPGVPSVTATTPAASIPSVCRTATSACMAATDVPGRTVLVVPGVGGRQLTDTVIVTISVENIAPRLAPRIGVVGNDTGPLVLPISVPTIGVVNVTLCPDGCASVDPRIVSTTGVVHLDVTYGGFTRRADVTFDRG